MRKLYTVVLLILIFQSCQQKSDNHSESESQANVVTEKFDTTENSDTIQRIDSLLEATCNCEWQDEKLTYTADLTYSNNGKPFSIDSLTQWINNRDRFNIKSLRLIDFDTIPMEMSVFENVETIFLEAINNKNVQGLEMFPKLRTLKAEEERFEIDEHSKWLKNIEVIHANKTKFSGVKSFRQIPNLKELRLSFSGFDTFPSNLNTLKCLFYFQTAAHTFCEIDLSQLDFSQMPCLNHVEFQSWRKNLSGVPKGLENSKTVKIGHPNLTKAEKEELKDL